MPDCLNPPNAAPKSVRNALFPPQLPGLPRTGTHMTTRCVAGHTAAGNLAAAYRRNDPAAPLAGGQAGNRRARSPIDQVTARSTRALGSTRGAATTGRCSQRLRGAGDRPRLPSGPHRGMGQILCALLGISPCATTSTPIDSPRSCWNVTKYYSGCQVSLIMWGVRYRSMVLSRESKRSRWTCLGSTCTPESVPTGLENHRAIFVPKASRRRRKVVTRQVSASSAKSPSEVTWKIFSPS
jgi:hypothetical protein